MGKKTAKDLYEPMIEHSNVEDKFKKAAKGKTTRPDVTEILYQTVCECEEIKTYCQ